MATLGLEIESILNLLEKDEDNVLFGFGFRISFGLRPSDFGF